MLIFNVITILIDLRAYHWDEKLLTERNCVQGSTYFDQICLDILVMLTWQSYVLGEFFRRKMFKI